MAARGPQHGRPRDMLRSGTSAPTPCAHPPRRAEEPDTTTPPRGLGGNRLSGRRAESVSHHSPAQRGRRLDVVAGVEEDLEQPDRRLVPDPLLEQAGCGTSGDVRNEPGVASCSSQLSCGRPSRRRGRTSAVDSTLVVWLPGFRLTTMPDRCRVAAFASIACHRARRP